MILGSFWGPFWSSGATQNHRIRVCFGTFFEEGLRDRFGGVFGSILEVFWTDFGRIFGIILEVFFMKNVVLPAWELIFQKFRHISWFLFCWRAFQK